MTNSPLPVILLVDGTKSVLEAMVALLEDEFRTLTASSPEEAMSLAHQFPEIRAVVLGLKYPAGEYQGIQIAVEVSKIVPQAVIVFHSGYPKRRMLRKIDLNGKPFSFVKKGRPVGRLLRILRRIGQ